MKLYKVYTEILNEGVWSSSALRRMRATPMEGRYFITDEEGNILEKGLKTAASVRAYFVDSARAGGYLGGKIPKIVNIHDNKKDGEIINRYFWKGKSGIDIQNTPSSIDEVYTEILNEIGGLDPSKALPFELKYDNTRSITDRQSGVSYVDGFQEYTFKLPSGTRMGVILRYEGDGKVRIDFNPIGMGEIPVLGDSYKSAYTIMNTVGTIVKDSLKNTLEKGITKTLVTVGKNEYSKKNPEQRQQLYTLFIKKAFPGAVIHKSGMFTALPNDYEKYL